jgi:hypothetical protein
LGQHVRPERLVINKKTPCQSMRPMIGNTSWLPIFRFNISGLGFRYIILKAF